MPTTYAHNVFGEAVLKRLPAELQDIVSENSMAYRLGLHGPDVLFYYKPFGKNPVSDLGSRLHKEEARGLFMRCKELLGQDGDPALLAYTIGFICHFMLDSSCHPFIGAYMEKTGARHDEIETEFDRVLMEKNGKNPMTFRPADFIRTDAGTLRVMARVLEPVTEKELRHGLRGMKFYTGVVVRPTGIGRKGLLRIMKIFRIYESMQGRVIRKKPLNRCMDSSRELLKLFRLSVPETVTVIEDYFCTLQDPTYLNARFDRNFE